MVSYTLTINSEPQGVVVRITFTNRSIFALTPTTIDVEGGTQVTVIADNAVVKDSTHYRFKKWENESKDPLRTLTVNANTTITAYYEEITYISVKTPSRRIARYQGKLDEEVYQKRIYALKDLMKEEYDVVASEQKDLEDQVGKILHKHGLTGITLHHYRNYSQELYSLKKRFTDLSLTREATITAKKWVARGLDPNILKEIAETLAIKLEL